MRRIISVALLIAVMPIGARADAAVERCMVINAQTTNGFVYIDACASMGSSRADITIVDGDERFDGGRGPVTHLLFDPSMSRGWLEAVVPSWDGVGTITVSIRLIAPPGGPGVYVSLGVPEPSSPSSTTRAQAMRYVSVDTASSSVTSTRLGGSVELAGESRATVTADVEVAIEV